MRIRGWTCHHREVTHEGVQVGLIWPDAEDQAVLRANQFVYQLSPGPDGKPEELILVLGNVTPPLVLGTPEEVQAMMSALGAVAVRTHGRYSISRGRLDELIGLLIQAAQNWDAQANGGENG